MKPLPLFVAIVLLLFAIFVTLVAAIDPPAPVLLIDATAAPGRAAQSVDAELEETRSS